MHRGKGGGLTRSFFLEILPGGGGVEGGHGANFFLEFDTFFCFKIKNTSNLIFLGFKVPSERFFHKNFKTGLSF
jgi:hypothetical protein